MRNVPLYNSSLTTPDYETGLIIISLSPIMDTGSSHIVGDYESIYANCLRKIT